MKRLFISLANRNDKVCLTIDCRGINPNGPGEFGTETDNAKEQHCYFNITTNDKLCNVFISKRIRSSPSKIDSVYFQSEHVLGKSKTTETCDATAELKEVLENGASATESEADAEFRYKEIEGKLEKYNISFFSSTIKMAYSQLPSGNMKNDIKETLSLANFPRKYNVSGLFSQLKYMDNAYDSDFQRELISNIENNEDLQKYLLASGETVQQLQEEIELQVTDGRVNDAQVRNQLGLLYNNILRGQNPYEIVFEGVEFRQKKSNNW